MAEPATSSEEALPEGPEPGAPVDGGEARSPEEPHRDPRTEVLRVLRSLRMGVAMVFGVRALLMAAGVGALAFVAAASTVGPVASGWSAGLAWAVVGLGALASGWLGWRPARDFRAGRVSRLFREQHPALVSATRSVAELANDRSAGEELVEAHAQRTAERLRGIRARRLWPWRRLLAPEPIVGLVALVVAGALLASVDRARAGAYALTHPGERDEGTRVARVVASTRARLRFPAYMRRADVIRTDEDRVEAPRGTAIRFAFRPLVPITAATLIAPGQSVPLTQEDGWWVASFVTRESGPLIVEVLDPSGRTLRDADQRTVVALVDEAPEVSLDEPEDLVVDLAESLALVFEARDEIGVVEIALCIRTPGGEVEKRRLETFPEPVLQHRGHTRIAPVELGARPGDQLALWIEARDSDDVSGPNVGRSQEITLQIASEATRREAFTGDLRQVLDAGLHTLADRVETPVPADEAPGRTRDEAIDGSTERYLTGLEALGEGAGDAFDPSVLRGMHREAGRARAREKQALDRNRAARVEANEAMVGLLEEQVLLLSDLLGRARLQDAAALTRELEELRREMRSLLAELRRTDSPEARRALMAALARARARLSELEQRLASMGEAVPGEFLNTDSLQTPEARDALGALQGALDRNDLDAAERALTALEQRIDALAKSLGDADEAYAEARFGPRQQAMAEALDRLAGLEAEQRQLAERTQEVRRQAAERALGAAGGEAQEAARAVAERARGAEEALSKIPRDVLSPSDEENLDRARQRLRDTAAALETGDLGEARRMASEAEREAERLARDLEVSALMFSGREGRTAEAAQRARRASESVRGMGRALDESLPRVADFVEGAQGQQMRTDADRQGLAREVADALHQAFASEPDGAPLSPEGAEVMDRVGETMERAREALRRGDPLGASRGQEEAARELTELREQLERQSRSQSGSGGGEGGQTSGPRRRVQIPEAAEDAEAARRRRRILDAMRDHAPDGYEDAVRLYYEELLR